MAGDVVQRRVRAQRLDVVVDDAGDECRRRLAQQPLDVRDPEQPALVGVSKGERQTNTIVASDG
jgi:hypothetical protein